VGVDYLIITLRIRRSGECRLSGSYCMDFVSGQV